MVGNDQSALEAMQANEAQVYEGLGLPTDRPGQQHFQVLDMRDVYLTTSSMNRTAIPPQQPEEKSPAGDLRGDQFRADPQHIFGNRYPVVQGFTGPGGICYQQYTPGYQGYDPTLAKQLVQQSGLGNVTINLISNLDRGGDHRRR